MRNWFPFTDYDFYGYLVSGFSLVFAIDYTLNDGGILLRENWTFVQCVIVVGIAYFVGQAVAWPASLILENLIARRLLRSPVEVLLENKDPSKTTRFIGKWILGRYYSPLPEGMRKRVYAKAAASNGVTPEEVMDNPLLAFEPAFYSARQNPDTCTRLDDFRNQYGLNRNMAFVALVTACIMAGRSIGDETAIWSWTAIAFGGFIALTVRFLKFYAIFSAELLRSFAYADTKSRMENEHAYDD